MTLSTAFDDLTTLVEGLTRPTAALPTGFYAPEFRYAPGRIDPEGSEVEDGLFWFDGFSRAPQLETTVQSTRVEYLVPLVVMVRNAQLNLLSQMKRANQDMLTISRAIEAAQSWSSGVVAVITGGAEVTPTENNESDVLLVMELTITVIEE